MGSGTVPASGTLGTDNVRDLDRYREARVRDGTWPISPQEHLDFFRRWLKKEGK